MTQHYPSWFSFVYIISSLFFSLHAGCLPETLILTGDTACTHAAVAEHQSVLSYDEETHAYAFGTVTHQQWHNEQTTLVELIIDGERVAVSM